MCTASDLYSLIFITLPATWFATNNGQMSDEAAELKVMQRRRGRCCGTVSGVVSIWEITAGVCPMDHKFNNSTIHLDTGGIILVHAQEG